MENSKKFHKLIACLISFVILSSSYIPAVGMYDMFSCDVEQVYKTSGLSDYYNLIALFPVKFVTKFVMKKTGADITLNNKSESKSSQKNNEKKSSRNNNFDIAFANSSVNEQNSNIGHVFSKCLFISLQYEFNIYTNYFELNVIVFLVLLMLLGLSFLARGETEDSIKNINIRKFRLG